jgi:organic hydroperoxide reductase OsmC/OhrA
VRGVRRAPTLGRSARRGYDGGARPEIVVHRHEARVRWKRGGAKFTDNRYSRGHEWSFDGGVSVPASASPANVPLPMSVAEAVDPEEALIASASSCHMLWFLSLAAKRGFVVDSYSDDASGQLELDGRGKLAFRRITLRPRIEFAPPKSPTAEDLAALHHAAHAECFIANSLKADVVVEAP